MPNEDQTLWRLKARDRAAWKSYVLKTQPETYGIALRIVRSPEDARDDAQETYVRLWIAIETVNTDIDAFRRRVAMRIAVDRLRDRRRDPLWAADGVDVERPSDATDAESELFMKELGELEPRDLVLLKLRYVAGLEFEEIAQVMGMPSADAARKAVSRALERLRLVLLRDGLMFHNRDSAVQLKGAPPPPKKKEQP